jgi:hypothetical protein
LGLLTLQNKIYYNLLNNISGCISNMILQIIRNIKGS